MPNTHTKSTASRPSRSSPPPSAKSSPHTRPRPSRYLIPAQLDTGTCDGEYWNSYLAQGKAAVQKSKGSQSYSIALDGLDFSKDNPPKVALALICIDGYNTSDGSGRDFSLATDADLVALLQTKTDKIAALQLVAADVLPKTEGHAPTIGGTVSLTYSKNN